MLKSFAGASEGLSTAQPCFGQALKPSKASQQLSKASLPHNPPQQLLPIEKVVFLLGFKLPRGTFWAGLKTLKSLAAAFEGLSTAQPSVASLEASRLLCHGASLLKKLFFYWASNCHVARFGQALKPSKASQRTTLRSSSPSVPLALPWCLRIGPKSCFYWASKLPRGTLWAGFKTLKSLAAPFDGLRSSFRRPQHRTTLRSSSRSVYTS